VGALSCFFFEHAKKKETITHLSCEPGQLPEALCPNPSSFLMAKKEAKKATRKQL